MMSVEENDPYGRKIVLLLACNHPHLVQAHQIFCWSQDSQRTKGKLVMRIVMDLYPAGSLQSHLQNRNATLNEQQMVMVLLQAAGALRYTAMKPMYEENCLCVLRMYEGCQLLFD